MIFTFPVRGEKWREASGERNISLSPLHLLEGVESKMTLHTFFSHINLRVDVKRIVSHESRECDVHASQRELLNNSEQIFNTFKMV
jgi:hypothetical protein